MSIDEAIALVKIEKECISRACDCDRKCNECDLVQDTDKMLELYSQLAKWLEELKAYRKVGVPLLQHLHDEDIYNKAIDDFAEKIVINSNRLNVDTDDFEEFGDNVANVVYGLAEQLKVGGENEESI